MSEAHKRDRLDLGWRGTTIQPGKRRNIDGVSVASIMGLQAQLYQAQESARLDKESGVNTADKQSRRKAGIDVSALTDKRNAGVEARDQKDKLHIKSSMRAGDRSAECYAALERKAALYEKLAQGTADDSEEQYEVDFLYKSQTRSEWLAQDAAGDAEGPYSSRSGYLAATPDATAGAVDGRQGSPELSGRAIDSTGLAVGGSGDMMSEDMARERERRRWEQEQRARNEEEQEQDAKRRQRTEAVLNLAKETKQNRDRVLEQKKPIASKNFIKLCNVQRNFLVQTGDPTGSGKGGSSIYGLMYGDQARFFEDEKRPHLKHKNKGMVGMASPLPNTNGSQFYITTGEEVTSLDNKHTVFGKVAEGLDILDKINEAFCDEAGRPYQNIRIRHTIILEDPFDDPPELEALLPEGSPEPQFEQGDRLEDDWVPLEDTRDLEQIEEETRKAEAHNRAVVLEMIGDLPEADAKPPSNVLFICKLNPVTTEEDLDIIFSRFGVVTDCDIIRDYKTGDSLCYGFIGFDSEASCEEAYFKMNNVLIDDRRIKVDFSQSVAHLWKQFKKGGRRGDVSMMKAADDHQRSAAPGQGKLEMKHQQPSAGRGAGRGGSGPQHQLMLEADEEPLSAPGHRGLKADPPLRQHNPQPSRPGSHRQEPPQQHMGSDRHRLRPSEGSQQHHSRQDREEQERGREPSRHHKDRERDMGRREEQSRGVVIDQRDCGRDSRDGRWPSDRESRPTTENGSRHERGRGGDMDRPRIRTFDTADDRRGDRRTRDEEPRSSHRAEDAPRPLKDRDQKRDHKHKDRRGERDDQGGRQHTSSRQGRSRERSRSR